MKMENIQIKNGVLVIDDKSYETFEEIDGLLCNLCGREIADQLWAEAYHMYKTDPEGAARAEKEMRNVNVRIK